MDLWRKPAHLLATQVMQKTLLLYIPDSVYPFTYDHRTLKTRLPVRSALFKQRTGGLVVRWVTTGESPLLYVFLQCPPVRHGRNGSVGCLKYCRHCRCELSVCHVPCAVCLHLDATRRPCV